jgi:hypothetical protein
VLDLKVGEGVIIGVYERNGGGGQVLGLQNLFLFFIRFQWHLKFMLLDVEETKCFTNDISLIRLRTPNVTTTSKVNIDLG